jgi:hypothetical protein
MSAILERLAVSMVVILAIVVVVIGVRLALSTEDFHWLNRAGALVVCIEAIVVLLEFYRRKRIGELEEASGHNPYIRSEALRAERQLVLLAIAFAVFGEFLHGFGDLILEQIVHLCRSAGL